MKIRIATPLHSYTGGAEVEAEGATVAALLQDLERQYPGIRFRIVDEQDALRPHVRVFVNGARVDDLSTTVAPDDEVQILQALSGG